LYRNVPQQELNLLQFTTSLMAQTSAGPALMPHAALCRYAECRIMPN
jgi:hypothetical protein